MCLASYYVEHVDHCCVHDRQHPPHTVHTILAPLFSPHTHRQLPFAHLDQAALDDLQVFGSPSITPSGSLVLNEGYVPPLDTRGVSNASMEALAPDDVLAADNPSGGSPTAEGPTSAARLRVASDPILRRGSRSGSGILKRDGQPSNSSAQRISFDDALGGDHAVVDVEQLARASADAALMQPLLSQQNPNLTSPVRSVPGRVQHSFMQSPLFARSLGRGDESRRGPEQLGRLEELQQAVLGTLEGRVEGRGEGWLERHSADGGLQQQQRSGDGRRDTYS